MLYTVCEFIVGDRFCYRFAVRQIENIYVSIIKLDFMF